MLASQHLLGFGGLHLGGERIERAREIRGDVLSALGPLNQDAEIVDFLGEAVAQLEVFSKTTLALQGLLGLGLVVPEFWSGDLLFELR
jgi:hypothetical protein